MKTLAIIACTAAATAALTTPAFAGKQGRVDLQALVNPVYTVEGDAFVRHNGDRYSNRPLYCNHLYAVVLAGDKPYSTLGHETNILGNLMFALVRDGRGKWLQHASDITSRYRPGRMEWTVKDAAWGETVVHLEVVPQASARDSPHGCASKERSPEIPSCGPVAGPRLKSKACFGQTMS